MNTRLAALALATTCVVSAQSAAPAPSAAPAAPAPEPSLQDALLKGKFSAHARVRYETVNQDGLADADALTARLRAGYTTKAYRGFQAMIEGEANLPLVSDYYDGTGTNSSGYAAVTDPEIYEINQLWAAYTHEKTKATLGRQRIVFDNSRFIGDVAWRQNQQTFDAAFVQDKTVQDLTLSYGYVTRVNRVFDDRAPQYDWHSDSHVAHAAYAGLPFGTLSGYAYLLDFDKASDGATANSTQTYGLSLAGSPKLTDDVSLLYRAEYAAQSDYGASALSYSTDYYVAELGAQVFKKYSLTLGYEVLGSDDGAVGFKTPLATLHAFNGWADKFLVTPPDGLRDIYGEVGYKFAGGALKGLTLRAIMHDFAATRRDAAYGQELDLLAVYPIRPNLVLLGKFAHYAADGFGTDTTKGWLSLQFSF